MTASGRRPLAGRRHAEPASPHTKASPSIEAQGAQCRRHPMYPGLDEATELIPRAGLTDITMEPLP